MSTWMGQEMHLLLWTLEVIHSFNCMQILVTDRGLFPHFLHPQYFFPSSLLDSSPASSRRLDWPLHILKEARIRDAVLSWQPHLVNLPYLHQILLTLFLSHLMRKNEKKMYRHANWKASIFIIFIEKQSLLIAWWMWEAEKVMIDGELAWSCIQRDAFVSYNCNSRVFMEEKC